MFKRIMLVVVLMAAMMVMVAPVSAESVPWVFTVTPDEYTCHTAYYSDWAVGNVTFEVAVPNESFHPIVHYFKEGVEQAYFEMDYYGSTVRTTFEVAPTYDEAGNILDKYTEYTFILETKSRTIVEDVLIHTGPCN